MTVPAASRDTLRELAHALRAKWGRAHKPYLYHTVASAVHDDSPEAIEACPWCRAVKALEEVAGE